MRNTAAAACVLAWALLLGTPAQATIRSDPGERTQCQALARVIWGDLQGQKMTLDSMKTKSPTPTAEEQASIDKRTAKYDEDNKLFNDLRALYGDATPPTRETMAHLRSNVAYADIKQQARDCL